MSASACTGGGAGRRAGGVTGGALIWPPSSWLGAAPLGTVTTAPHLPHFILLPALSAPALSICLHEEQRKVVKAMTLSLLSNSRGGLNLTERGHQGKGIDGNA